VFWGRPTEDVQSLIATVQKRLREVSPSESSPLEQLRTNERLRSADLWLMPSECQHITTLEITHSKTEQEIKCIVDSFRESIPFIADFTYHHRARVIKPAIGFDAAAIALSFVPAAGEGLTNGRTTEDDAYTYHHLRRDLYDACNDAGVKVESRYVVPTAHLTVGRFIDPVDFNRSDRSGLDSEKVQELVSVIEELNEWLQREYWPKDDGSIAKGGQWLIGAGKGLCSREGKLWYGGGQSIYEGKGF
jgi:vesicle-fusing ATPase